MSKKLTLSKETLRQLDDQDLSGVVGGTVNTIGGLGNLTGLTGTVTGLTGNLGGLTGLGGTPTLLCVGYSAVCLGI